MREGYKLSLDIKIDGLNLAQAIAIEDMLAVWCKLGGWGCNRVTAFYAAGDGDFHPRILINGQTPRETTELRSADKWFTQPSFKPYPNLTENEIGDLYYIDYDQIAWSLREDAND